MKRGPVAAILVLCSACSSGTSAPDPVASPEEVTFRVIAEGQSATSCVEPPDFALVRDDDDWIEVYSRESDCQPGDDVRLPAVRFDHPSRPEVAIAVWWKAEGCLGYSVATASIVVIGAEAVVSATSGPGPDQACATAVGILESFLAADARSFEGVSAIRFVLDDVAVGTLDI